MVGITLLNMAVNLIPILYDSSIVLKKKFKRRYNKMSRYMRERENKERRIKRARKAKYQAKQKLALKTLYDQGKITKEFVA